MDKGIFKDKIYTVLHVGGRITSKRWHEFIGSHRPENYITVIDHPLRNDPLNIVTTRIIGSPGEFIKKMPDYISPHSTSPWVKRILELSDNTEKIVSETLAASKILSEAHISRILSEKVIKNSAIFLGNSMPVRDMEMFSSDRKVDLVWGGNRGASGID